MIKKTDYMDHRFIVAEGKVQIRFRTEEKPLIYEVKYSGGIGVFIQRLDSILDLVVCELNKGIAADYVNVCTEYCGHAAAPDRHYPRLNGFQ
jgi:hypothetical protein